MFSSYFRTVLLQRFTECSTAALGLGIAHFVCVCLFVVSLALSNSGQLQGVVTKPPELSCMCTYMPHIPHVNVGTCMYIFMKEYTIKKVTI